MTEDPAQFAYGANEVADCPCPAQAAGLSYERTPAETYDAVISPDPDDHGIVDEDTARKAWLKAIDIIAAGERHPGVVDIEDWRSDALNRGRQIATELDWMEDNDD